MPIERLPSLVSSKSWSLELDAGLRFASFSAAIGHAVCTVTLVTSWLLSQVVQFVTNISAFIALIRDNYLKAALLAITAEIAEETAKALVSFALTVHALATRLDPLEPWLLLEWRCHMCLLRIAIFSRMSREGFLVLKFFDFCLEITELPGRHPCHLILFKSFNLMRVCEEKLRRTSLIGSFHLCWVLGASIFLSDELFQARQNTSQINDIVCAVLILTSWGMGNS